MPNVVERLIVNAPNGIRYLLLALLSVALAVSGVLVHPLAPIGILVGFWLLFVSIRSPFVLLMFFVVFMTVRLADFFPILGAIRVGKIISFTLLAVFLFSKLLNRDLSIVRSRFNIWFILFCGAVLLSSVASTWPSDSLRSFLQEFTGTIVLFFLLINIVINVKQIIIFQICMGVICATIGGYALVAQIIGRDPLTGTALVEGSRAGLVGALADPNNTALVILMATPFLIVAVIESRPRFKLPFAIMSFLAVAGILSTQSRGGLLGLSAGVGLVMNRYIKNKVMLVVAVIGLLVTMATAAKISERTSGGAAEKGIDESSQQRLDAWYAGLRMLLKDPVSGVGFNQFNGNFLEYAVNSTRKWPMTAHNSYVLVAAETGLPGFVTFMMLIYLTLRGSHRMGCELKKEPNNITYIVKSSTLSCTVAFFVAAFFLSWSYNTILYIHIAFIAACVNVFDVDDKKPEQLSNQPLDSDFSRLSKENYISTK